MGCGSSKVILVQPLLSSPDLNEEDSGVGVDRGDSAVSKVTADSGVGLYPAEVPTLPGALHRTLPPLSGSSPGIPQETQRPRSSEILEQLLSQGIIPAHPRDRACKPGEANHIMLDKPEMTRTSPPSRLESLKTSKEQTGTSREELEEDMRHVEERHKEEEPRLSLRSKSARVRGLASAEQAGDPGITPVETLQDHLPDPCSGDPEDPQDSLLPAHTESEEAGGGSKEAGGGSTEAGGGSKEAGGGSKKAGGGPGDELPEGPRIGDLLTASLLMENDVTFQQTEQAEQDLF